MRIQNNITAMNAQRNLSNNNSQLSSNLEKLSSGYRINRAADDAAGLAISEKMRAQITGLETAETNANDGISLVQTAEGALTEVHAMLNRMVELSMKASNGTYSESEREKLQSEVDQLLEEIDRIAESTTFNNIPLLSGGSSTTDTDTTADIAKTALAGSAAASTLSSEGVDVSAVSIEATGLNAGATVSIQVGDGTLPASGSTSVSDDGTFSISGDADGIIITIAPSEDGVTISDTDLNALLKTHLSSVKNDDGETPTVTITGDIKVDAGTGYTETELATTDGNTGSVILTTNSGTTGNILAEATYTVDGLPDGYTLAFTTSAPSADLGTNAGAVSASIDDSKVITIDLSANGTPTITDSEVTAAIAKALEEEGIVSEDLSFTTASSAGLVFVGSTTDDAEVTGTAFDASSASAGTNAATQTEGKTGTPVVLATAGSDATSGVATISTTASTPPGELPESTYDFSGWAGSGITGSMKLSGTDLPEGASLSFAMDTDTTNTGITAAIDADGVITFTIGAGYTETSITDTDLNKALKAADISGTLVDSGTGLTSTGTITTGYTTTDYTGGAGDGTNLQMTSGAAGTFGVTGVADTVDVSGTVTTVTGVNVLSNTTAPAGTTFNDDGIAVSMTGGVITVTVDCSATGNYSDEQITDAINAFIDDSNGWAAGTSNAAFTTGDGSGVTVATTTAETTGSPTSGSANANADADFPFASVGSDGGATAGVTDTTDPDTDTDSSEWGDIIIQVGSSSASYNQVVIQRVNMTVDDLGLTGLDISSSQEAAVLALDAINAAIDKVSDARSQFGAIQNRLDHTINNLGVAVENMQSAESRVRDVDMAEEMMNYTKNNILVQSAQAMLAQANQVPQGVLQLLQ